MLWFCHKYNGFGYILDGIASKIVVMELGWSTNCNEKKMELGYSTLRGNLKNITIFA